MSGSWMFKPPEDPVKRRDRGRGAAACCVVCTCTGVAAFYTIYWVLACEPAWWRMPTAILSTLVWFAASTLAVAFFVCFVDMLPDP